MSHKGAKLFPGAFVLDALTEKQLHHLFLALALHTKTTREEQADWVKTRFKIWEKLVNFTMAGTDFDIELRTRLLKDETELKKLWKNTELMERVFTRPKAKGAAG